MGILQLSFAAFTAFLAPLPRAQLELPRPTELCAIVEVVDGDTLHVWRNDRLLKLRLCSVDTEEKISGWATGSASKPETVFGEATALWAKRFFEEHAQEGVRLLFPEGEERHDAFGRLLCHVLLADGTDFNLLLVRQGKSPYFNKYGNSLVCHDALVAAQRAARAEKRGIWSPGTNRPRTAGAPAARRDYGALLAWWDARAQAIDDFRRRRAEDPEGCVAADDGPALQRAVGRCATDAEARVTVFGAVAHVFEEVGGECTVLLRSSDAKQSVRIRVPSLVRRKLAHLELEGRAEAFRQNYVYVTGVLAPERRGFRMMTQSPEQWRLAGPE